MSGFDSNVECTIRGDMVDLPLAIALVDGTYVLAWDNAVWEEFTYFSLEGSRG